MSLGTNQQWRDLSAKRAKRRVTSSKLTRVVTEKACRHCGEVKPIAEYHRRAVASDGYESRCKACVSIYRFQLRPAPRPTPVRGEAHHNAKLTQADVDIIEYLINERETLLAKAKTLTNAAIAAKFEVHQRTIDRISSGRGWVR